VAGRCGGVLPSGGRGPPDVPAGELFGLPPRVLLHPVVVPALRVPIAQAGPAARFVRGVVLEVGSLGRPSAHGSGAGGVPDLGQVPQHDSGVMPPGLVPVITLAHGERLERDDQIWLPRESGGQPPGAVPAG
jgi:hypothetical protein